MYRLGSAPFLTLATASLAMTVPAFAQAPAYMHALAVPPANVGTCVPARAITGRDSVVSVERHLVMTTLDPDGRREIFLFMKSGGYVRYSEFLTISYVTTLDVRRGTGSGFTVGSNVLARFTPKSGWTGRFSEDTIHAPVAVHPAGGKLQRATVPPDHRPVPRGLHADEISNVRRLADWMQSRCQA